MALFSFSNYRLIYRLGTHIAISCEQPSGPRWHRMRRQFADYKKSKASNKGDKQKLYVKFATMIESILGWGSEARFVSLLTLSLGFFSYFFVFLHADIIWISNMKGTIDKLLCIINFALSCLLAIVVILLFTIEHYRKNMEKDWIEYNQSFGITYPDIFDKSI